MGRALFNSGQGLEEMTEPILMFLVGKLRPVKSDDFFQVPVSKSRAVISARILMPQAV